MATTASSARKNSTGRVYFESIQTGRSTWWCPEISSETPNGLCFNLGEQHLYINDTTNGLIRRFDVAANGSLGNEQLFATGVKSDEVAGKSDSLQCDELGNI